MKDCRQLSDFKGEWRLLRRILDRRTGQTARLSGNATFAPAEGGLVHDEAGTLRLPGQAPMPATRRYLWRGDGDGIAVWFDDGRAFHRIGPGSAPRAHHACDPDSYAVEYSFVRWPVWRAVWRVTGPRKDYTMISLYCPARSR